MNQGHLWSAHGHRLTGKLALWALAMMSLHGDSYIDYSYPDLNTQCDRDGIVHNTSGTASARPSRDCEMQELNPLGMPSWKGRQEEMEAMTRMKKNGW